MPIEKETWLQRLIGAIRDSIPGIRDSIQEYSTEAKEDPAILMKWLENPIIRYSLIALVLVIAMLCIQGLVGIFTPAPPQQAVTPLDQTVLFQVLCTNPDCGAHYGIQRDEDFDNFPIKCSKCDQKTAYQARRITSGPKAGQWEIIDH